MTDTALKTVEVALVRAPRNFARDLPTSAPLGGPADTARLASLDAGNAWLKAKGVDVA